MNRFDPIVASDNIKQSYVDYITTSFDIADKEYAKELRVQLEQEGFLTKGPYLDVSGSYKTGKSLKELIADGTACRLFAELEPVEEKKRELKLERPLYLHQVDALKKATAGNNLVVTTGTGSGKTECFLLPIINSLLRENEAGTLKDKGVRAIIIYPMNALANDQIKRMRRLLRNYKDITFGLYNGNTEHNRTKARDQYRKNSINAEFPEPLPNEVLSREEMQEVPPHILITNYSMLEYMLLRPKDDAVFSSAKLHFVVLDEAHVYKGTTGMETSMLMRRLRARIGDNRVQYILTSATLGGRDANKDIVDFGKNLCGVEFYPENIIRSQDASPTIKERLDIPTSLFKEIAERHLPLSEIFKKYGIDDYAPNGDTDEKIYEFLLHCDLFYRFRAATETPKTIHEIRTLLGISKEELIDFVAVCTAAEKNGASLIKAKYHFFVRALEGAYVTLGKPKRLYLNRREHNERGQGVFEIAICQDCGRIALVGKNERGQYRQVSRKSERDPDECDFFLLWDDASLKDMNLEDAEGNTLEEQAESDFVICAHCGAMGTKADASFSNVCDCENAEYISLKRVNRTKEKKIAKCPACGYGSFRSFYLGADAATAVLCTELFEQLPDAEVIAPPLKSTEVSVQPIDDPFAGAKKTKKPELKKKEKQFLCFSDSRSEAAFFANYMEKSYQEFLRRRGIFRVAKEMQESGEYSLSVKAFADRLTRVFESEHSFDLWSPDQKNDVDVLHEKSKQNAWIALLNELFNARRSTSLSSMGIISFEYIPNTPGWSDGEKETPDLPAYFNQKYGLSTVEARHLLELIILDGCYTGAVDAGKEMRLNDAERDYIFFTPYEKKMVKCKTGDTSKSSLVGWAARARADGKSKYYPNARLSRLCQATGMSEDEANKFLMDYWDCIFNCGDSSEYSLNICDFRIRLNCDPELHTYRCRKCGRITVHNVKGKCSVVRCDGKLEEIDPERFYANNHYMALYNSDKMRPLQMKEHTAQLSRNRQSVYQDAFVNGRINALSCSTTFEMGVDVGGLETVCMRDIPPSPSNYVQRAGRAGRASHTAAFVMTYAKLSSHDFTYYEDPSTIISGKINAPHFSLENKKVIYRHIFAVALSEYLANNPDVYDGDNANIFLNEGGYERLVAFLQEPNERLNILLQKPVPAPMHDAMGINDGTWVEELIGEEKGILSAAVELYHEEINKIETELKRVQKANPSEYKSLDLELRRLRCGRDDKFKRSLIDFWTRNNVLPKYGFPVDTVELQIAGKKSGTSNEDLTLARDLQMAIAEYAPGSGVIADGKLYTSRYIRMESKAKKAASRGYYAKCHKCDQFNFTDDALVRRRGKECISCGEKIPSMRWRPTLEPRLGFITDKADAQDAPLRRPERDYKTDDHYVGDSQHDVIKKMCFSFDGAEVELQSTANDSLVVVGSDSHRVCPYCGWTSNANEALKPQHNTSWGSKCTYEGQGDEYHLSHVFKTDVVQITFLTAESAEFEKVLSTMYALLEGLSRELGIERTDLKGCLHRKNCNGQLLYSIILYDAVAGGAGHVRRLVTDDGKIFSQVLRSAYNVVANCDCQPSCYRCLRNYYNQRIHDLLDRNEAKEFLSRWLGDCVVVEAQDEINSPDVWSETENVTIEVQGDSYASDDYDSWGDVFAASGFDFSDSRAWDQQNIDRDCLIMPTLRCGEETLEPYLVWEQAKIAVFDDLSNQYLAKLQNDGWRIIDTSISVDELKALLEERE